MSDSILPVIERLNAAQISRGVIVDRGDASLLVVALAGDDGVPVRCALLSTSDDQSLTLEQGDEVLVWMPAPEGDGIVIGRIGATRGVAAPEEAPAVLTLEAKQALTLRVGEGSITIREDGKILIKGKDLVSHAQRMNRIRGGAVSIN
jgi:hypothetical protein